jgi:hypothetical protein
MLKTVEGIYRNGQVELAETPEGVGGEARVLVTFLSSGAIGLRERGIDPSQAAELRGRLATFADEWDSPEMAVYDDYEANRRQLETR